MPERREAAAAAARDVGTAVAKPADGARAALADQKAHRGRAECVESCRSHRTHRISKGVGRAGRLESLLAQEGLVAILQDSVLRCVGIFLASLPASNETCTPPLPPWKVFGGLKGRAQWESMGAR